MNSIKPKCTECGNLIKPTDAAKEKFKNLKRDITIPGECMNCSKSFALHCQLNMATLGELGRESQLTAVTLYPKPNGIIVDPVVFEKDGVNTDKIRYEVQALNETSFS